MQISIKITTHFIIFSTDNMPVILNRSCAFTYGRWPQASTQIK